MKWLTYSDRELLLQTFESLKAESRTTDHQILTDVSEWVSRLTPNFGFEHGLGRDIAALSRYLLTCSDRNLENIARGSLLYILRPHEVVRMRFHEFGLLDKAFIASYALHEIRQSLGEIASYNPPRLTHDEQRRAEGLFLDFINSPLLPDTLLISQAQEVSQQLTRFENSGLFRRLRNNIAFLISVLNDSHRNEEQCSCARAALSYLICEGDIIDDRLGFIGYLDDNFILQIAVDLIEPKREPFLELLDATIGVWPFLNNLILDDGSGGRPISEYTIINAALSCFRIRQDSTCNKTALILPSSGPMPFLLGFIAALGLLQEKRLNETDEDSFTVGQKVLVDNSMVAEFAGVLELADGKRFGLKQYRLKEGQKLESVEYWPMSDLRRLVPVEPGRATRGQLSRDLGHSDVALSGLEYLFNTRENVQVADIGKRVVVVMPVAAAFEMASQLELYGSPLRHTIPMGHLGTGRNEVEPWSSRFGAVEPLLLFVSDLDRACEYAESAAEENHLVIVDTSGRNLGRQASLARLQQYKIPTLMITEECDADELDLGLDDEVGVWEWSQADLSALLWPPKYEDHGHPGVVARYEQRLSSRTAQDLDLRFVEMPLVEDVFQTVRKLGALARSRGDDSLAEFDEIVAISSKVMFRLLRFATPLDDNLISVKEVQMSISRLSHIREKSLYLSQAEQIVAHQAQDLLSNLFLELKRQNPKALLLNELLIGNAKLSIICPDPWQYRDLEILYGRRVVVDRYDDLDLEGAVIPAWFRKERMRRFLIPPITEPLVCILYETERRWHKAFSHERNTSRKARAREGGRSRLFPHVKGWTELTSHVESDAASVEDAGAGDLGSMEEHIRAGYRHQVYSAARSDGTEAEVAAHLVLLEGNAYAFLSDSYRANVVTHLLDDSIDIDDEKAEIKQRRTKELRPNDAILFHRESARDVIRSAADKILPTGVRETSSLWRTALLEYKNRKHLTSEALWQELRTAGCPLRYQTIKGWLDNDGMIAPQTYERDVEIVRDVTRDEVLGQRIEDVFAAISEVRGAHLRVSYQLARQVLHRAASILKRGQHRSGLIEIGSGVVVVRLMEIDNKLTMVRQSLTNRLLEDNGWNE